VQVNPPPDLLGVTGRDVVGFQLPLREHRELILTMELLAVGTAAAGIATGALALDKRTGEHFAQSAQAADEATAQLQFRIAGHKGLLIADSNTNVIIRPCQDFWEICKNGI
jgi:hypothetical protein